MTTAVVKPKVKKFSLQMEEFCKLYATSVEFFGNGTQSYLEAYKVDMGKPNAYKTASVSARRLLVKASILDRINQLLEESTLNDAFVDKQLAFLITQNADFGAKMSAIKEYNALKKRVASGMGQINVIGLILKKWGLDDIDQVKRDESRILEG